MKTLKKISKAIILCAFALFLSQPTIAAPFWKVAICDACGGLLGVYSGLPLGWIGAVSGGICGAVGASLVCGGVIQDYQNNNTITMSYAYYSNSQNPLDYAGLYHNSLVCDYTWVFF